MCDLNGINAKNKNYWEKKRKKTLKLFSKHINGDSIGK